DLISPLVAAREVRAFARLHAILERDRGLARDLPITHASGQEEQKGHADRHGSRSVAQAIAPQQVTRGTAGAAQGLSCALERCKSCALVGDVSNGSVGSGISWGGGRAMTECPAVVRGGAIPVTSVDEQRRSREAELVRRAQAGDRV